MDEAELRALLDQNHEAAFGWALSCAEHRREEAEDVLQTVYLKFSTDERATAAGRPFVRGCSP